VAERIGLSTVVTKSVLQEFQFLKFSWELFHGPHHRWHVRCDSASYATLSKHENVACVIFTEEVLERPDVESQTFWKLAAEKMRAMSDAWNTDQWDAVLYMDADLIITSAISDWVLAHEAQLLLTPHYFPDSSEDFAEFGTGQREARDGYYNGGFVLARDRTFCAWWTRAYCEEPGRHYGDQTCLSRARRQFTVAKLDASANIGFWRSPARAMPLFKPIPSNCRFLHCHLFQPLRNQREWLNRMFALHCLDFLQGSGIPEHRRISEEILARDWSGWYRASHLLRPGGNGSAQAQKHSAS
jgi:hypothetical protein